MKYCCILLLSHGNDILYCPEGMSFMHHSQREYTSDVELVPCFIEHTPHQHHTHNGYVHIYG